MFWDRDPELTLGLLGPSPRDPSLSPLDKVPEPVVRVSPLGAQRLREAVQQRPIDCTLDLTTWQPAADRLPPLAAGLALEDNSMVLYPHPGGTELNTRGLLR